LTHRKQQQEAELRGKIEKGDTGAAVELIMLYFEDDKKELVGNLLDWTSRQNKDLAIRAALDAGQELKSTKRDGEGIDKAIYCFKKALTYDPNNVETNDTLKVLADELSKRGRTLIEHENGYKAIDRFKAVLEIDPNHNEAKKGLAEAEGLFRGEIYRKAARDATKQVCSHMVNGMCEVIHNMERNALPNNRGYVPLADANAMGHVGDRHQKFYCNETYTDDESDVNRKCSVRKLLESESGH